ncbi:MAG: 3-deoxy-7-phosphoheptulonate synthase [Oscillospiraceae bacterium]|nr:3-deoxy-7-phosphoheptulonate synthase [Oscillospiraceae bacterium]
MALDNQSTTFIRKLPIPQDIKNEFPLSMDVIETRNKRIEEMKSIFRGEDDRLLLVIGPCSADNEDSVMEYIHRLTKVSEQVKDKIMIIPRVYTNKPRTTGAGYKGMLHQPNPEDKPDMLEGIIAIRKLHTRAIAESGLVCADEMLYPENYRYLSDVLGYVAIGARSVENQQHRLLSSGIDVPVGMKNPTGGDFSVMMNSIIAAQSQHTFLYRGWEVESKGNPYAHAILRGYVNSHGQSRPNYHYEDLMYLIENYEGKGLSNPSVIIDCNHANSGKKYIEQIRIAKEVLHNCQYSKDIKNIVKGLMIESYIEDGNQKIGEGVYGKSITDACLGWEKSERLIYDLADIL